jgi:hypothetical protein
MKVWVIRNMSVTAKVAKIINNRTIVINAGKDKNVTLGMKFLVSDPLNIEVVDPDTQDPLGPINVPKIRVQTIKVDEKYSICETYEYEDINRGGSMPAAATLRKILEPQRFVREYATFDITDTQKREIRDEQSLVRVGDLVEQVIS